MFPALAALQRLSAIPHMQLFERTPLAPYTRFGLGGPAALLCDTANASAFVAALQEVAALNARSMVIGGGTNLIVSDAGFDGIVLRYTGSTIEHKGKTLRVAAGAVLQDVVDRSIGLGLDGLETMTGIPGSLGGAVYGNAGAYGHSMQEVVTSVEYFDGTEVRVFDNDDCQFGYRESIFKEHKEWVILSADLHFETGDPQQLARVAGDIRAVRDAKYPPSMKCAGSIFKNFFLANLPAAVAAQIPPSVVREGKVPSAWFLEQVGAKGMRRGDIHVADYHANLIFNAGEGTATDLVSLIEELKRRVQVRFGVDLEEEVQYVGFEFAEVV
jgi:UDP-N-acetylmuramate dehydrogenase